MVPLLNRGSDLDISVALRVKFLMDVLGRKVPALGEKAGPDITVPGMLATVLLNLLMGGAINCFVRERTARFCACGRASAMNPEIFLALGAILLRIIFLATLRELANCLDPKTPTRA